MITEDYVSFETAKLLKETGFDEICYLGYNKNGEYVPTGNRTNSEIIQPDFCFICCPTLQMAMKWLREEHDFNINNELIIHGYFCSISHIVRDSLGYIIDVEDSESWETPYYKTYKEACEAAIKYCLENLI